jgi:hypothetical protein
MGLYDYVYSCGCVECDSTLNGNKSKMPPYLILVCSDHKLMIGNKFEYNFSKFINKFWKRTDNGLCVNFNNKFKYNVEILDFIKHHSNTFYIVRFKTDFDTSNLDIQKQIFFSEFNDEPNWIETSEYTILTLIFDIYVE